MTFTVHVPTDELNAIFADMTASVEEATRPAAQAAAQVLYENVKLNVSSIGRITGNLDRSIYQVFSERQSGPGRAVYEVSWNARKAPHGHLVEFGHVMKYRTVLTRKGQWLTLKDQPLATPRHVGAQSFVRRAISKFPEAIKAAEDKLLQRIAEPKK